MSSMNADLNRNLLTCGLEVRGDVDPGELRAYLYGHPSKRTPQHRFRCPQVGELSTAQHQLETWTTFIPLLNNALSRTESARAYKRVSGNGDAGGHKTDISANSRSIKSLFSVVPWRRWMTTRASSCRPCSTSHRGENGRMNILKPMR